MYWDPWEVVRAHFKNPLLGIWNISYTNYFSFFSKIQKFQKKTFFYKLCPKSFSLLHFNSKISMKKNLFIDCLYLLLNPPKQKQSYVRQKESPQHCLFKRNQFETQNVNEWNSFIVFIYSRSWREAIEGKYIVLSIAKTMYTKNVTNLELVSNVWYLKLFHIAKSLIALQIDWGEDRKTMWNFM